jgi:transcriptional regulator with XRE-family HTH domain
VDTSRQGDESFRGLVLRHRGRTGLTQRELAARLDAGRRTVQNWEAGVAYPSAELLRTLIRELLTSGGLTMGREAMEAHALWTAAEHEAPRMHTPFDEEWFARLLGTASVAKGGGPDQDWGVAPDIADFVGRDEELATLRDWILGNHCRLVAIVGMGGIGKTMLAARAAQELAPTFERTYWRSVRDAPPTSEWLIGAIGFVSDQRVTPPQSEAEQLAALLQLLRNRASLLVLDNFETLLEPGQREGGYRDGFGGYGRLLHAIGAGRHQSCLVLTSRESPSELATLGSAVRTLHLGGLGVAETQVLLANKELSGDAADWSNLIARFDGNSLAQKVICDSILEVCGGDVAAVLEYPG